jgi:hypothetical protein
VEIMETNKNRVVIRSYLWGVSGSALLLAIYFVTLTLSNSLVHAIEEFRALGVWIVLLTAGFGIQTGLFAYVRTSLKARASSAQATASMAATGGMSATSMVACCMHHVTDILPILGVSAATLFLVKYQSFFLAIGVASNFIGITVMLRLIQKQELYEPGYGIMGRLLKVNMDRAIIVNTLLGITLAAATLIRTIY